MNQVDKRNDKKIIDKYEGEEKDMLLKFIDMVTKIKVTPKIYKRDFLDKEIPGNIVDSENVLGEPVNLSEENYMERKGPIVELIFNQRDMSAKSLAEINSLVFGEGKTKIKTLIVEGDVNIDDKKYVGIRDYYNHVKQGSLVVVNNMNGENSDSLMVFPILVPKNNELFMMQAFFLHKEKGTFSNVDIWYALYEAYNLGELDMFSSLFSDKTFSEKQLGRYKGDQPLG